MGRREVACSMCILALPIYFGEILLALDDFKLIYLETLIIMST